MIVSIVFWEYFSVERKSRDRKVHKKKKTFFKNKPQTQTLPLFEERPLIAGGKEKGRTEEEEEEKEEQEEEEEDDDDDDDDDAGDEEDEDNLPTTPAKLFFK